MLYPLKFQPRLLEKIWGGRKIETILGRALPPGALVGESWEIYDFPPGVIDNSGEWVSAHVANGPLAGQTLHELTVEYGTALLGNVKTVGPDGQFPILVKYLDGREDLSVQVHPDEAYAATHPGAHLKTEAWYVLQHEPGARLYKGINPGVTREALARAAREGHVENCITAVPARDGQCHYLPSGTVHALGAGILVAEVQTPSDTTFRLFDFNRLDSTTGKPRKLHIDEALECIDFSNRPLHAQPKSHVAGLFTTVSRLVTSPYFKLEKVRFTEGVEEPVPYDQPVVWIMLNGQAQVKVKGMREAVALEANDVVLLPAAMEEPVIKTRTDCTWLEVTFPTGLEVE